MQTMKTDQTAWISHMSEGTLSQAVAQMVFTISIQASKVICLEHRRHAKERYCGWLD